MSILTTEWNWDTAKEVWQEEAREEGIGMGLTQGLEKGREEEREEIARNALAQGLSVEMVQKITGLSPDEIERLKFYR